MTQPPPGADTPSDQAHAAVTGMLSAWSELRALAAELGAAEHPDLTDRFGRTWTWWSGDLYIHDGALAGSADQIAAWGLPEPGLAERNPNYAGLCAVCRREGL